MYASLNPEYCIRNEKGCSFIVHKVTLKNVKERSFPFVMPIPPLYGQILSFFIGEEICITVDKIEKNLNVNREKINTFVEKVFENSNPYITYINKIKVWLPSFLLIRGRHKTDVITNTDFNPYDDFVPKRPDCPFFLNIMITSKCYTNCIYCYADRSRKDDMTLDDLMKIIDDAKKEQIPNVLISGGDILATKNWKVILRKLNSSGYAQIISTKIPLKEDDIIFLKENNINGIQISIDSLENSELFNIVRVDRKYSEKMKNTFKYSEKYNLAIDIKTVLTKYNANIKTIKNMYDELLKYKNINSWNIVPAFFSSHNILDYDTYKTNVETLNTILDFIKKQKSPFPIEYKKIEDSISTIQERYKSATEFVQKSKGCIANIYGLSIMANGKATICEMLYYNETFYIGDMKKESIKNIWNSSLALKLNFSGKVERQDSPCYSCTELNKCKKANFKKVCIVDVISTHGTDKWEYPDPRCPHSINADMHKVIY